MSTSAVTTRAGICGSNGLDAKYDFVFAELPAGGQNLQTIALAGVAFPGGIQWDGTDLAVGDQQSSAIDQISVSGSIGDDYAGTTPLDGSCDVEQFAIFNGKVFAPDVCAGDGNLYPYPAGGAALNGGQTVCNTRWRQR